jgi:DNA-binding CsgD family transcriptional regulator
MSSRMVGREGQLALLRRLATTAARGEPGAAMVLGEAGIGKTRLLNELVDHLGRDDVCVLRGHCTAAGSRDVPLGPFRDAVRDLRRALGESRFDQVAGGRLTDVHRLLPELDSQPAEGPGKLSPAQVQAATAGLLRDAARQQPLLLVLEDVHWSDESSRAVLDYLVRSMREEKLAVVLTVRTDDPAYEEVSEYVAELGSLRRVTRVDLTRLGSDDVAAQVRQLRPGASIGTTDVERITEVSGGVPLLVEELVAAGTDHLDELADRLLGHRLRRLSPAARSVVEAAAVAQVELRPTDLATVADLAPDAFDAGLESAVRDGVLTLRAGRVEFRHALFREAAVAALPPARASRMHRAWAERLEHRVRELPEAVAVAQHWTAGDRPAPAIAAWRRAAALAAQVSAYPEQMRMLREAADLWPEVPAEQRPPDTDLAAILTEAAEAGMLGLGRQEASQQLLSAARAALPADAPAARRAWLAILWDRTLWHQDGPLTWQQAVATVDDIPAEPASRERALACRWAARVCLRAAQVDSAHLLASEAVLIAQSLGDVDLLARAQAMMAPVESALGDDARAVATAQEATRLADRTANLNVREQALQVLADALWTAGRTLESRQAAEQRVELLGGDEPAAIPASWGMATTNLADVLMELGRWDEADRALNRVLSEPDLPEYVFWFAARLRDHLAVWRGMPRPDRTGSPADPQDHPGPVTDVDDLLPARYTYLEVAARHEPDAVPFLVRSALADDRAAITPGFLYPLMSAIARTLADRAAVSYDNDGDDAGAPELGGWAAARIERLVDVAPPRNDRDRAWEATIRADLARRLARDRPEDWSRAVAAWRRADQPHPLGWALLRSGVAEASTGQVADARQALAEALAIGEALGATPLVDAALAAGRQARLRLTPTTAPGGTLGLTERELDVLRLVAEGLPNAAIGQQLFISPKTVSVHVSHILDKLGVATRGEAAATAHRQGVLTTRDN